MVNTYEAVGEDNPFEGRKVFGKCPHCGADVYTGKFGPYCSDKCGMTFGKAMGATLTEDLVKELLNGNKIFLSGLKSKKGGTNAKRTLSLLLSKESVLVNQYKVPYEFINELLLNVP